MDDKQNLPHISDRMPRWLFCLLIVVFYLGAYPAYLVVHWTRDMLWRLQPVLATSAVWWRLVLFEYTSPAKRLVSAAVLWALMGFYHGPGVTPSVPGEGLDIQELD